MRNYTLLQTNGVNTWTSWQKQFLLPLASDVKSLYDYWLYFSPNFEEITYQKLKEKSDEEIRKELENEKTKEEIENLVKANKKLWINALNYRQYAYIRENNIKAAFGEDIDLPAGAVVISNVMPIGNNNSKNDERKDISNYIIQYSSSADYYLYSIQRQEDYVYKLIATFTPHAGEIYGNQLTLQIPSYFPRFYVNTTSNGYWWDSEASGVTLAAFNKNSITGEITNQIQDIQGLSWQDYLEIHSKTYINTENIDGEEIILDATYTNFLNKVENTAIPSYNISIIENQKQIHFKGVHVLLY